MTPLLLGEHAASAIEAMAIPVPTHERLEAHLRVAFVVVLFFLQESSVRTPLNLGQRGHRDRIAAL